MNFFIDDVVRTQPFGLEHLGYVTLALLACWWFIRSQHHIKLHQANYHRWFLIIFGGTTIVFYLWSFVFTGFGLTNGLPLHACRISTLLSLYYYLSNDRRVMPYLFYFGIFAVVAIAYPSNVHPLYTHLVGYTSQITHIMLLLTWLYIVLIEGYRPTIKEFKRVAIHFTYLLLFVWGFNHLVGGGEYFYILSSVNRPFLKTLPEGVWVLANIAIMVLVMTIKTYLFSPHLMPFKLNFKQNET